MSKSEVNFPIYKKRFDSKSFYKIISKQEFEEIQLIGKKAVFYFHEVKIYPDQLLMNDMLEKEELYLDIEEDEYLEQKKGTH